MAWTVQNVADLARLTLNDDDKIRNSDASLLLWTNDCLRAMALIAPHLFTKIATLTPVVGQSHQDVINDDPDALALYDILLALPGGEVVLECDYYAQVSFNRSSFVSTAGIPQNWSRFPTERDKQRATRYFLWPKPASGTTLVVEYSAAPATLAAAGTAVPLPIAYQPAVANYLVYRAESKDDVHVVQQRSAEALQSFLTLMGAGVQTKQIAPEGTV